MGLVQMEIYVVAHETFTEQNVFFTHKKAAEEYLEKVRQDWRIETLKEGTQFEAEFLHSIKPPCQG